MANVVIFAAQAANPVVISDAWYYLDVFVEKALDGSLEFADLFVKRGAADHSLPLHKLVLLANVHWFELDLTLDTAVGLLFALASLSLMFWAIRKEVRDAWLPWLGFAAVCAVYLSLNATAIFEWPLLTMGFSVQFFFFLLFVATWSAMQDGRYLGAAALAAVAAVVVADGAGVIAVLAASIAAVLLAFQGQGRARLPLVLGMLLAAIVVTKAAVGFLVPDGAAGVSLPSPGSLVGSDLLANLGGWIRSALSDSVLHGLHLQPVFGEDTRTVQTAVAALLGLAHLGFWWQAVRRPPSRLRYLASCIMLLFYGLLAGIIVSRVPEHGNDYLHQPRYVIFYQLNLVALLLMGIAAVAETGRAGAQSPLRSRAAIALAVVALLGVQVFATRNAWKREPFQQRYVEGLAKQMGALARNPAKVPDGCSPLITICRQPEAKRRELMATLKDNELNVFSAQFQERHDLPTQ